MPKLTVDGIEFHSEDLTENGKAQLASLQFLEVQMQKTHNEMAVYQTAQRTYVAALKAEIDKSRIEPILPSDAKG
jgi:predicted S18 family serine protease